MKHAVLSDSDKKRAYDQYGHAAFDPNSAAGAASGFGGFDFNSMDFSDIFSDLFGFGGFSDGSIFGNTFNNRNHYRRNGMQNGTSIKASKTITFDEAINGCTKNITVNYKDTCKTCNGTCENQVQIQ